jgi:hypothetical protein
VKINYATTLHPYNTAPESLSISNLKHIDQSNGKSILYKVYILAGDINSIFPPSFFAITFNLKDVLLRCHGLDSEIPTRKEGRRINYMFASEALLTGSLAVGPCTTIALLIQTTGPSL